VDRNHHTALADGGLDVYLTTSAQRGFYKVTFRPPGANVGTPTGGGGGGGGASTITSYAPATAIRGTSVTVTATLPTNPPAPPPNVTVTSFTLGGVSGTTLSRPTSSTVWGTFLFAAGATAGAVDGAIAMSGGQSYTKTGGFTVA
jgi:hypothetical protein